MSRSTAHLSNDPEKYYKHPALWLVVGILVGMAITILYKQNQGTHPILTPVRESMIKWSTPTPLIDPLVSVRSTTPDSPQYADLEDDIRDYIETQKSHGLLSASVQYRNINDISGFVIDPKEQYYPASLYKVLLMIAYYRIAESDPSILSDKILYDGTDNNAGEVVVSKTQLTPNTTYTVEELIEHMIKYSDNNALDLLDSHLTDSERTIYDQVYGDLNIDPSSITKEADSLTVEQYSLVLSALYNASYLDRQYSEHALELMTETDFNAGLRAGVPSTIQLAQKFGEANVKNDSGAVTARELHNCGIVYYPDHPYRLCIMTKGAGDNIDLLEATIAHISQMVYEDMTDRYPIAASSTTH